MFDYMLIYNFWFDYFVYFVGLFSDEVIMLMGELNCLDYWLREIEVVYKKVGIYECILWGMVGDYGLVFVYGILNLECKIFELL